VNRQCKKAVHRHSSEQITVSNSQKFLAGGERKVPAASLCGWLAGAQGSAPFLIRWQDTEDDLSGRMALTLVTLLSVDEPTEKNQQKKSLWDKIKPSTAF